jgi:hypothetical protein
VFVNRRPVTPRDQVADQAKIIARAVAQITQPPTPGSHYRHGRRMLHLCKLRGLSEVAVLLIPSYEIRNQPPTIGVLAKLDARGESAVGIVVFHLSKSYLCGGHLFVGKILLAEPV